jgi:O-antigen/teichoic acid export membrane protein
LTLAIHGNLDKTLGLTSSDNYYCRAHIAPNMNVNYLKYLPNFVRNKLAGRHSLQSALGNFGWLLADRGLRLGVGLVVGVWIARYLGPQRFGLFSFAAAFAALFSAIATLGLDSIVIRELAKHPERKDILMGSAFVLKLLGSTFAVLLAVLAIFIMRHGESLTIWLVSLAAAGFLFQSLSVIDFYFQSKVRSKYTVLAAGAAFILITLVKIALLLMSASLIYFAWAGLAELALSGSFLIMAYRLDRNQIRSWHYDRGVASHLLKDSWPLIFASFAILIQARIDQVMLGNMIGNEEVGQYSAAMRLLEVVSVVPVIIVSTLSPHVARAKLISEALYRRRLLEVYRAMTITFLLVAIPTLFFGGQIVQFVFGSEYKRAGILLSLFSIRLFFANFGVAKTLFITNESLFRYSLMTAIVGVAINIAGNYILIPLYRSEGAIIASIISFSVTTFVIDIFYARTRVNLRLMLLAVIRPLSFRSNTEK